MTATHHWFKSRIRHLDSAECQDLLRTTTTGRIAFADDSGPDIFPVNFSMDGEDVLIATSGYGAIARAATGARVAFEVDDMDHATESGWSVVVRGRADRVAQFDLPPDPTERPYPWAEGNRSYVLRIHADQVTGVRLLPT
ncbi:pyridoxamine 5'-phosphate oxidase family protein [Nocardioides stalactiti]|uniref:pyridoxamine 5'-phosphate oxidase family protein n=1 Tax=Nocardioides stalactiti TaxID=2755356 RepID=UPI001603541A|nr:pyridoxamine 5'-phosphate oxidase family protein [Nocardioides stalactiti]